MAEYIEREAFIESQQHLYCENCARRKDGKGKFVYDIGDAPCRACGIMDVLDAVEDFPAADVQPVARGKWEWNKNNGFYYCSKCGAISPREDQDGEYCDCPNFCPNCGADMREKS